MDGYEHDPVWVEAQSFLPEGNRLTASTMPDEYVLTLPGADVHIDHYRPASPRARIVLFHGVGGNGRLLSFVAVPLMRHGFEVVCPDLPLYGHTRCEGVVTYDTWVTCGTRIVEHFQGVRGTGEGSPPLFLFGLSAGGMLAYQVACACDGVAGLIVTCLLDQRDRVVAARTASRPLLGAVARPLVSLLNTCAGRTELPMKLVSNMKAIANDEALVDLLMRDETSSGARVPIAFPHAMLNPKIEVEPERFRACPVLLVHPGDDHWTDVELSNRFYNRLACEKETVVLDGAGHFPIEEPGLRRMEAACVAFIECQLP